MGIDLKAGGRNKNKRRTDTKSADVYLQMVVELYKFLARRTDSTVNKKVLKLLILSRMHRPPMTILRAAAILKKRQEKGEAGKDPIIALPSTMTNDVRLFDVPKMRICALRFSSTARARITKAGGECLTFDQLAIERPTGEGCIVLQGRRTARKACRHFGPAPGVPHSHTKPYVRSKGRKFEKARGRRNSCGYKK